MQHVSPTNSSPTAAPARLHTWFGGLARRLTGTPPTTGEHRPSLAGTVAPPFAVTDLEGTRVTLTSLLDPVKPLLLVFINPTCTSCHEALKDIGGWQHAYGDRLDIAVLSTGEANMNRPLAAEHGLQRLFLQRDRKLINRYGLTMAPAAVVVHPDGRIAADPYYGQAAIRQLVATTLELEAPPEVRTVGRDDPAPRIDGVDLNGKPVSLDDCLGAPFLLLFWDPGCGYCEQLLPLIRAFEPATTRVRLVVVSKGSVTANRQLGFTSPIVLDDERTIARAYGISGTPGAVLIGARGTVASEVAEGAHAVRAYIDRCHVPIITPIDHRPDA